MPTHNKKPDPGTRLRLSNDLKNKIKTIATAQHRSMHAQMLLWLEQAITHHEQEEARRRKAQL